MANNTFSHDNKIMLVTLPQNNWQCSGNITQVGLRKRVLPLTKILMFGLHGQRDILSKAEKNLW